MQFGQHKRYLSSRKNLRRISQSGTMGFHCWTFHVQFEVFPLA
jgi:hypothetical protein